MTPLPVLEPCGYRQPSAGRVFPCAHPRVLWATAERCAGCELRAESPTVAPADDREAEAQADAQPVFVVRGRKPPQPAGDLGPTWADGLLCTRDGRHLSLANVWYAGDLFVVLSGPSLTTLPLDQLSRRGVCTLAVNNAATVVRPTFWTYVDPPEKFHEAIWHDPGVIKLVPARTLNKPLRRARPDGALEPSGLKPRDLPGVVGYARNSTFDPATYLTEPSVNWGNNQKSHFKNGRPHVLNVMFTVFKLAYYLGFRRVYLLGCDFRMDAHRPIYAFDERKHAGAVESNNSAYLKINSMLADLRPRFEAAGLKVYNCYAKSGLLAFPHLPFTEALAHATRSIPPVIRTAGWYDKASPERR